MVGSEREKDFKSLHELAETVESGHTDRSDLEEKALIKKIDLFLLPTLWLMYLLSYIDRTKSGRDIHTAIQGSYIS